MEDLGTLGGDGAVAAAASGDGLWIVGRADTAGGTAKAFRRSDITGMLELPMADAVDVSEDGAVIVGLALRWRNGEVTNLGGPGGCLCQATAVSGDGLVVVGWMSTGAADPNADTRAFRWTDATGLADLGTLGGGEAIAEAVNRDGAVVVGQARDRDGLWHAFRWTAQSGMVDLKTLGGAMSAAFGVSADGNVVVGQSLITDAVGSERAFRWTPKRQMQDLERALTDLGVTGLDGWTLTAALDVSADGRVIVGYGRNPANRWEAWRAVLPLP